MHTVRRGRFLTDDLLIGAALVTFFVLLGIAMTAFSVGPTRSQGVPTLVFGIVLGFAVLAGALRVAQFRAQPPTSGSSAQRSNNFNGPSRFGESPDRSRAVPMIDRTSIGVRPPIRPAKHVVERPDPGPRAWCRADRRRSTP